MTKQTKRTIGFIGLGHMGVPMVANLLKAGEEVSVYDIDARAYDKMAALGAKPVKSLRDLRHQDVIITSVQTEDQVKEICLGTDGIFLEHQKDLLFIDSSSIDYHATRELHAEAKARGVAMLDAPVSGGVAGAEGATLIFMVGGTAQNLQRAEPILSLMGKRIIHAGPEGSGQAAKICNNLLLAISMIGVSEAFNLAEKLDLTAQKFFEISGSASGQCWAMTSYCPAPNVLENVPSSNGYRPGFAAKMMLKDLHLAESAANTTDVNIPLGRLATDLYAQFVGAGASDTDFSGIINFIKTIRRE